WSTSARPSWRSAVRSITWFTPSSTIRPSRSATRSPPSTAHTRAPPRATRSPLGAAASPASAKRTPRLPASPDRRVKISFYVSDHGYGHATRSIALARALVAVGDGTVSLEIVNHHAAELLRRSLAPLKSVSIVDRRTDVGFVCREDRLAFDTGRTALNVWSWISGWKHFVAEEVERLRNRPPDLVMTDVAPQPLLVAEELRAPSV